MIQRSLLLISFILILISHSFAESLSEEKYSYIFVHLDRYPEMEASDLYKLVYQATNGSSHYGVDKARVLAYLRSESHSITKDLISPNKIIEPIGENYVRVHLVPYLANGYSLELLSDYFVNSMEIGNQMDRFKTSWQNIIEISKTTKLGNIQTSELINLGEQAAESNYPPYHHSEKYRETYSPHYRILTTSSADSLMRELRNN